MQDIEFNDLTLSKLVIQTDETFIYDGSSEADLAVYFNTASYFNKVGLGITLEDFKGVL
jgi:hypothetical protein